MANRRCISCKVVLSPRFQRMKPAAKSLYMVLVALADDDGVVEAHGALITAGARKTALTELMDNGYVAMLDEGDCIVWVVGWQTFNTVDVRYGTASYYRSTLKRVFPDIKLPDLKAFVGFIPTSATRINQKKTNEENASLGQINRRHWTDVPVDDYDPDELPFGRT